MCEVPSWLAGQQLRCAGCHTVANRDPVRGAEPDADRGSDNEASEPVTVGNTDRGAVGGAYANTDRGANRGHRGPDTHANRSANNTDSTSEPHSIGWHSHTGGLGDAVHA